MEINLPKAIARYFSADASEAGNFAQCFTEHAVVKDEGKTYVGLAAIQEWKQASAKKYTYTSEPLAYEEKESKAMVTSRITGNFPGSPIDLRYAFELDENKITFLEIAP